jgi:HEAT repeat protein
VTTPEPGDDPRIAGEAESAVGRRRQAVRAGHDGDGARALILATDPDPTVRGAALGALARLGALDADVLRQGLEDGDAAVRRRACELAGRVGPTAAARRTGIVDQLVARLDDAEPSVVETAAWALGELGGSCGADAIAELSRVATTHRSPLCRESAVAALGAIGAPETLAVVLGALDDTANIRRRAAIALAAFDDPRADEGLRRCLGDRDWQVRQAAEELLADS